MASDFNKVDPLPGQESVWDYPRPPRLERALTSVRVLFAGEVIAKSNQAFRVLETSHPPTYYFPLNEVKTEFLVAALGRSICEYKGIAKYWSLNVKGVKSAQAAWSYPEPRSAFLAIKNCVAFYASRVDECWVGDEKVQPQPGDFYGGWITSKIVGPFKANVGTTGW